MPLRFLCALLFISFSNIAFAQSFNSADVINKGIKYHDKGDFTQAAKEYQKVPMTDTNYLLAQYELALTYSSDSSKYDDGLKLIDNLKQIPYNNFYRTLSFLEASILDESGQGDKAVMAYDNLLKKYPEYPKAYFEAGVLHLNLENYEKANELFEQSLIRNPFHFRSHYYLGKSYLMQGRITESLIATHFALMATSDANQASGVIDQLLLLTKGSDTLINRSKNMDATFKDAQFDEIAEVLISRVAANKKFKLKTDIDDIITRQLQVVYELAKYRAGNDRFVNQFYVPHMQKVWKDDYFNEHMLFLFSEYGIKEIDKKAKRKKKGIAELKEDANAYFYKIPGTRELNYAKRKGMKSRYLAQGQNLAIGQNEIKKVEKKETSVFEGPFKYYESGVMRSEGRYSKNNKKDGLWKYYNNLGNLVETVTYKDGKFNGWQKKYTYYGVLDFERFYEGEERLTELKVYKKGKLDYTVKETKKGEPFDFTSYNKNGTIETKYKMKDDDPIDGLVTYYYDNKQVASKLNFENKKIVGTVKRFYENGQPKAVEIYKDGKLSGECKFYYDNGSLKSVVNYDKDETNGPFKSYYINGNIRSEGSNKNGKYQGEMKNYDYDGKLLTTVQYNKGMVKKMQFARPEMEKMRAKFRGNEQFFYGNGSLASDLKNSSNGLQSGVSRYYYYSGPQREEINFKDGKKEGTSLYFYTNGNKYADYNLKNNEFDGLNIVYDLSGDTSAVGLYDNGKKVGAWRLFENGRLKEIETYKSGKLDGPDILYNVEDGTIRRVSWYDAGFFTGFNEYAPDGNIAHTNELKAGKGPYVIHHSNGKEDYVGQMKDGLFDGKGLKKYFDGKTKYTENLNASNYIGERKVYYYNGNINEIYNYSNDGKILSYEDYSVGGMLERKYEYTDTPGYYTCNFYIGEKPFCKTPYRESDINGEEYYYGENGEVAGVINYIDGNLLSYSYLGADKKMVPAIDISSGTGAIKMFYANGQKSAELNYVNGYLDGPVIYYYTNGQVRKKRFYEKQMKVGKSEEFNQDGKLLYQANYNKKGNLDGAYKQFDKNGKLFYNVTLDNGILVNQGEILDPKTGKMIQITFANNRIVDAK